MEERHKNLTDSERLNRLAAWLDDDYRLGAKMSEDAISGVVSDLKRIASQIKEPPAIPQQPQGEICSDDVCQYCVYHGAKCSTIKCTGAGGGSRGYDGFVGRKLSPVA